ncbi:hypothetical protein ACMFMG_008116 [Clarireedia jacksonii]
MSHQVSITLRALNADIKPAERVINLNPNKSSIKIGRASKSVLKGLLGAADNAWFDSPVMSRNHAEIAFNKFTHAITIQDTNSMHGTFVNGQKLHNGSELLGNGDTVVFGNEVRRGFESFPACSFKVFYEVTPWMKSRSYSVPDSSDEEDEESNFSVEITGARCSGDDVSIESVRPKTSRSIEAIDLTGDDTPKNLNLGPTSIATPVKEKVQHIAAAPPPEISLQQLHRQSPEHIVAVQLDTDSDSDIDTPHVDEPLSEDELLSSSGLDEDEIMTDSSCDVYQEMPKVSSRHDNVESQNEQGEIEMASSSAFSSSAFSSPAPSVTARQDVPAVTWQTRPPYENIDIPESHVRTRLEAAEDDIQMCGHDDDDGGSEISLYEANQEGIRAMIDDGLLENAPVDPFVENNAEQSSHDGTGAPSGPWSHSFLSLSNAPRINDSAMSPQWGRPWFSPYQSLDRQPSPSDAAMVKGAVAGSCTADTSMSGTDEHSSSVPTTKSLGDKTGKHAFFQAREDNRARLQAHASDPEDTNNVPPPVPEAPVRPVRSVRFAPTESVILSPRRRLDTSDDYNSSAEYKDMMESSPESSTRVHPYYFSSDASSCAPESPVLEKNPVRSGLRIDDIIDGSSPNGRSTKRKAEEISGVLGHEVRTWASSVEACNSTEKPSATASSVPESSDLINTMEIDAPVALTRDFELRPAKRPKMRKFAEAFGYAAIGAVAAATSVFGVLVATAPDFQ